MKRSAWALACLRTTHWPTSWKSWKETAKDRPSFTKKIISQSWALTTSHRAINSLRSCSSRLLAYRCQSASITSRILNSMRARSRQLARNSAKVRLLCHCQASSKIFHSPALKELAHWIICIFWRKIMLLRQRISNCRFSRLRVRKKGLNKWKNWRNREQLEASTCWGHLRNSEIRRMSQVHPIIGH